MWRWWGGRSRPRVNAIAETEKGPVPFLCATLQKLQGGLSPFSRATRKQKGTCKLTIKRGQAPLQFLQPRAHHVADHLRVMPKMEQSLRRAEAIIVGIVVAVIVSAYVVSRFVK
jgi:hypothetical protein